jgi:hypothetical protein
MTLIAAFPVMGAPALLGDLLITSSSGFSSRKKIVRLADNLGVAWTGDLLVANIVIPQLQDALKSAELQRPTMSWLEKILASFNPSDFGNFNIHLIGWLVEPHQSFCFRWNSGYVDVVFTDDVMTDGNGSDCIEQHTGLKGIIRESQELLNHDRKKSRLTYILGRLMRQEMHGPPTHKVGYGGGYEALIFSEEGSFEYVEVLYYSVEYKMSPTGEVRDFRLLQPFVKVGSTEGNTVVWWKDTSANTEERHLVTSPGKTSQEEWERLGAEILSNKHAFESRTETYCQLAFSDETVFKEVPVVLVHDNAVPIPRFTLDPGGSTFVEVSKLQMEGCFRSIRADLAREANRITPS